MRCVIFLSSVNGHYLEYLHHYYQTSLMMPDVKFFAYVPSEFLKVKNKFLWEDNPNFDFMFLSPKDISYISCNNALLIVFRTCLLIRKICRKEQADRLLLTTVYNLLPFLLLFLPSYTKLIGILYVMHEYKRHFRSKLLNFYTDCIYKLSVMSKKSHKLLVLNDSDCAFAMNRRYKTRKFIYLPDPIPNINFDNKRSDSISLNIPKDVKVLLHFGGLSERKGTLDILDSISYIPLDKASDFCFVFAGSVYENIKDSFYSKVRQLSINYNIKVFDYFCSYEQLSELCSICDMILIPYKNPYQSSGVLGYAAKYNKPVLAPEAGMLGNLVNRYQLGKTISKIDAYSIFNGFYYNHSLINGNNYVSTHRVDDFVSVIINNL